MELLTLKSERLTIRHLNLSDLVSFHRYRSNPDITKYQGFDVMTIAEAEDFIIENSTKLFGKAGEWIQYAIEKNESGELVGDCAIKMDENDIRIAEIGITISHLQQKKGYAKEALLAITDFLFAEKEIQRIVEIVDAENTASINLLKSAGFKQEGSLIENVFFKGDWTSEFRFVKTSSDLTSKK